ncbi:MAG: hypothetical protein SVM80_06545 [Halobacteriota archaeon]|nr:hypothetical protein [Halobacteriota archaeon]
MNEDSKLTEKIKKYSKKIGIDVVGFCDPMLYGERVKGARPESFLEGAKTIIVIGLHLNDLILDTWYQDKKSNKSFHFADSIIESLGCKLKDFISDSGYESKMVSYNPGLYLKDSAALAGIGPIGKNNLLITDKFGSQVRLRALVTDAPLVVGKPIHESKYCRDCDLCIRSCPAKALNDDGYNRGPCLSYSQSHLRVLSDTSDIWCNICIESCPVGK